MNLIKLNGNTTPAPTTYEVSYKNVNGEKTQVEDGTTYIEQVRADVPNIKVGWTNLTQEQVTAITNETANDVVNVQYYYGTLKSATMTAGERALKLKTIDDAGNTYWNLSFTLEG